MNILIIDDAEADHTMCVDFLSEDESFRFLHAYTSAEGIEMYHRHSIDCVLLDYHLPDMDGLEVLKRLSAEGKDAPIIMMTAEGNEIIAVTAMKLGSQDYLPKKVITASALRRAVERAAERAEMLRRMEQYRADLERSNRDLEQFATIVAHDLKSPLRAIAQHLSLIKDKNVDTMDEKSLRSLGFAVEGTERMRILIDALFTYAKLGFSEPSMVDVSLEAMLEVAGHDLEAMIEETGATVTSDPLPYVLGDPVLLAQLLQNLLGNALKYCREKPRIHIGAVREEAGWRISVRDNGIGIPESQHEKIFAIFRRLHQEQEYPGIGLGLAVCRRIVQQHGGMIGVNSGPGKGSEFYFTLPCRTSLPEPKKASYG